MTEDIDNYQQGREKHIPLNDEFQGFGRDYAEN